MPGLGKALGWLFPRGYKNVNSKSYQEYKYDECDGHKIYFIGKNILFNSKSRALKKQFFFLGHLLGIMIKMNHWEREIR